MRRRLPSLSAMRGFEAAARHLSFTLAARELNLTQGAVSRQVATLEQELGVALFARATRRITLTEAGAELYDSAVTALDAIERAAGRIRGKHKTDNLVHVSVLPTIGTFWLMPLLHKFTHIHPEVDVRIHSSIETVDFTRGDIDVAIRVGPLPGRKYDAKAPRIDLEMSATWSGVQAESLFPDILIPVVAKRLAVQHSRMSLPELLTTLPLIHTSSRRHAWPDWLRANGIRIDPYANTLECGHFFMSLDEARAGHGVALVPNVILADTDARKNLKLLQPTGIGSAGEYYLLTSTDTVTKEATEEFTLWIRSEANALRTRIQRLSSRR